jgi:2-oxoglutarate/2-oxoacid ferredoxin oxidoreductase subunit beta
VTFNDHEASTKSYRYTRAQNRPIVEADFVPLRRHPGRLREGRGGEVAMHDGSIVRFRQVPDDFDPSRRDHVYRYLRDRQEAGEVTTGLLFMDPAAPDMHDVLGTVESPLSTSRSTRSARAARRWTI